ncbi:hypothetical protein [Nocardioides sp.]|uniref:hypothetical protein n=1 Tax=Nocardioides sp. TaxID=35761 RepID=UPI0025E5F9C8|nr:hypothetical protein [Nocardioides sp.]
MTPTADDFFALARSSPWRWTTLHLRHRSSDLRGRYGDQVEVWLARPDGIRLRGADGTPVPLNLDSQRRDGRPTGPWRPPAATYRPDGLVADRPDLDDDDGLFWENYSWVAMLDPVELSHDVDVADVRVGVRAGRPTWEARLRPLEAYEPRCGCCSLLRSPTVDREEWGDRFVDHRYPDHHEVALDVQTGVVVRQHPVGGEQGGAWLENDILEVDA